VIIPIASLDDPRLDPYRELKKTNQSRDAGWFIAEGRHVARRMLASRTEVVSVLLAEHAVAGFAQEVPDAIPVLVLPDDQVDRLVGFEFHAGIIACGRRSRVRSLVEQSDVLARPRLTLVACPHTILPDNLGSIIRICSAFGADALLVGEDSTDPFTRRTIRVSMGNIFELPIVEPRSLIRELSLLKDEHRVEMIAATGHRDGKPLPVPRPAPRIALLLGHEAHGLSDEVLKLSDLRVTIPMSGRTDSLNVANAAAVLLYQFTRVG
jgi:tRNA G18 (ribose-2'-O)-methylase SpoU